MHVVETGKGDPTLVFLHGTGGDMSYFKPQVAAFSPAHRTLSPDLPGHGKTGRTKNGMDVASLADSVSHALEARKASNAVLVGHSLGGTIALELAARTPTWLRGVVLIDVPILIPSPVGQALAPLTEAFRTNYAETVTRFATDYFFPGDSGTPELRARVLKALREYPEDLFLSLWQAGGGFDAESALRACQIPLQVLHATVPCDLDRLKELAPQAEIRRIAGSSHYVQLDRPEEVNSAIRDFVSKLPL